MYWFYFRTKAPVLSHKNYGPKKLQQNWCILFPLRIFFLKFDSIKLKIVIGLKS